MGCCKACGVDFKEWMMYFLEQIHGYDNDYSLDLSELFPDNLLKSGKLTQTPTESDKKSEIIQISPTTPTNNQSLSKNSNELTRVQRIYLEQSKLIISNSDDIDCRFLREEAISCNGRK